MKTITRNTMLTLLALFLCSNAVVASAEVTVVAPTTDVGHELDLMAVSEIFKDTDNLEAFEWAINDPQIGVNNLDLDNNGLVDYLRVVEEVIGTTHVIIIQAALGDNDYQDVATIQVEQTNDQFQVQIHGHEVIYGPEYYVVPTHVHVHTWPIITWITRPLYRPYRSVYYWGYYPRLWKPWRPVHISVYRPKVIKYTGRNAFVVTKTRRVKPVTRVVYKPRTSTKVSKSLHVSKTTRANGTTTTRVGVKKTTTKANGTQVTKKAGVSKTRNKNTGTTTVKKGKQKTKTNKKGQKTKVKKTKKVTHKKK